MFGKRQTTGKPVPGPIEPAEVLPPVDEPILAEPAAARPAKSVFANLDGFGLEDLEDVTAAPAPEKRAGPRKTAGLE